MSDASATDRLALVGYDGSPSAAGAIETGARLLPGLSAEIVHLWAPPFTDNLLRRRLRHRAGTLEELIALIEHEGAAEAERLADNGVALAVSAGWRAHALVRRSYGGEGLELAQLAEQRRPAVLVVGSRGMGGVRAVLGSVSDAAVHFSPVPVLVVPHPLLTTERSAGATGPVLVAHDGSTGAREAVEAARSLFAGRDLTLAAVGAEAARDAERSGAAGADLVVLDPVGSVRTGRAVADALARHADERGAALIVVGSRGQTVGREILLGSVAMAVLHHGHRPVLVVPSERFED